MSRARDILAANRDRGYRQSGRIFQWLLVAQWAFAIVLAVALTPYAWSGTERTIHFHVKLAIGAGLLNALPIVLIQLRPTWWLTRHVVVCVQMLWSALFITITGGRIETHLHVFGSLVVVAFYRDWRLLVTASVTLACDHLARSLLWPESVYGVAHPEWWQFLEYAAWVSFEAIVLVFGCRRAVREMGDAAVRAAKLEEATTAVEAIVAVRTRELRASLERCQALIDSTDATPFEYDPVGRTLLYVAPRTDAGEPFGGYAVHRDDRARVHGYIAAFARSGRAAGSPVDYRMSTQSGRIAFVRTFLSTRDSDGSVRGVTLDMTKQKQLEVELQQAQKLESVGRLAAGVAHEINTPIQFVGDSIQFVRDSVGELTTIIDRHRAATLQTLATRPDDRAAADALAAEAEADLPYLREHVPAAIERALDGMRRVAVIVQSMKVFAHPDAKEMAGVCLNQAIQSTLTIARNEWKDVADLEADYGELPLVTCHGGQINQAILNIVINAAHAMSSVPRETRHKLVVSTRLEGEAVAISIGDSGGGIPDHVRDRMFDPFFTTKPVGKGTGQGLAIARSVIVDKHHGTLTCETEVGVGTTFVIRLPIAQAATAIAA